MQEELLQFKLQKVYTLVDLHKGKRAIGTKWVYRNKKDERGLKQSGFEDLEFPDKVYKVEKALYGLHQAPRAWYETLSTYLIENGFKRGTIDKTLFIKKDKNDAQEVSDEFNSILMETNKALLKDTKADDVDVYLYRSMIGSLLYLTTLRLDIMFTVCACVRFQIIPKVSHLQVVKRIFIYLKGQPKLSLWYPKDSPLDLESYSDSDYAGANLDRKSTTGGCQFLRRRLVSWQCKKQIVVANSTTEAEYQLLMEFKISAVRQKLVLSGKNMGEGSGQPTDPQHTFTSVQLSSKEQITISSIQPKKTYTHRKPKKVTKIPQSSEPTNLVIYEEMYESVKRAATTATSLDAEQDSGRPRCQETIGDIPAQTRESYFDDGKAYWNGIEVSTAATSKDLLLLVQVNAVRLNLLLLEVNAVRHKLTTVKKVNGVTEIHALIDGKRIVVFEATIKSLLQFNDEGGVECLPNSTIFEEIAHMRYERLSQKLTFYKAFFSTQWKYMIHTILQCLSAKTPTWNEFSSTVASIIIFLATNQRFNFSKFILEGMLRNLDPKVVKFLMYPRFIQLLVNQLEGLLVHHREYNVPCHTKKIFANMKRTNKDFSSNDTPLFPTMSKVLVLEQTKSSQELRIESFERKVKKLERSKKRRTHKLKRLYKVGLSARVMSSDDEEPNITLVDEVQGRKDEMRKDDLMFDAEKDLAGKEVVAQAKGAKDLNEDEITLA
ncbi:ribonuclease H-like domain, reverse transcriptase, RNA-dependent DNA polymerase [Tanacetum coccineum]